MIAEFPYFLEARLRGAAKRHLRSLSGNPPGYHPHLTFVRPFMSRVEDTRLIERVAWYCTQHEPIKFTLGDEQTFPQGTRYLEVIDPGELLAFDAGLEEALSPVVCFDKKLADRKTLHATIHPDGPIGPQEPFEQYLLRVTLLKHKRIRAEYDLVNHVTLTREEALDKERWRRDVQRFLDREGLVTSKEGFRRQQD